MSSETRALLRPDRKRAKPIELALHRIRLGTRADCDVVLRGDFASEVHAVLENDEGSWQISNRSEHGTFVNGKRVDLRPLVPGDRIQLGRENVFHFELETIEEEESATEGAEQAESGIARWVRDNPTLLMGLGGYGLLIAVALAFLGQADSGPRRVEIGREEAKRALIKTRELLVEAPMEQDGPQAVPGNGVSGTYFEIVRVARSGGGSEEREELADALTKELAAHFVRAWHLESQRRWADAGKEYRAIVERLPNQRLPATRLALRRMRTLRGRLSAD